MTSLNISRVAAVAAATLSTIGLFAPGAVHAAGRPSTTVVARGLDAPKYLTFGPGGLYVAESGRGGPHCVRGVAGIIETRVCAGATGSIARITGGRVHRVERRLASATVASTHGVSGVTAVAFTARHMAVLFDDGGVGPTGVSGIVKPFGAWFGKLDLARRRTGGRLWMDANVAAFQATHPQPVATLGGVPGETLYDSDPHDMVAYRGGFAVADAGANDVVWVHRSGQVTLLARLPTRRETAPPGLLDPGSPAMTIDAQAVPSSVAVGPDGALYVGLLRGVPSLPRGRLDILESSTAGGGVGSTSTGALLRAVLHGSTPTAATDLDVRGLHDPIGLAVSRTGTAYITNDTSAPGHGEVIAVTGLGRQP